LNSEYGYSLFKRFKDENLSLVTGNGSRVVKPFCYYPFKASINVKELNGSDYSVTYY
jgi:hypothetical protein